MREPPELERLKNPDAIPEVPDEGVKWHTMIVSGGQEMATAKYCKIIFNNHLRVNLAIARSGNQV